MYARQYVENDLLEKSPVELIRLLYSKAIEKSHSAIRQTTANNVRGRNDCLARVMEIIAELQGSLNLEAGGEVAVDLARLYDYVQWKLIEAVGNPRAVEPIEEVRVLLTNLYEGWSECDPPPGYESQKPPGNADAVTREGEDPTAESAESGEEELPLEDAQTPVAAETGTESGRVWTL